MRKVVTWRELEVPGKSFRVRLAVGAFYPVLLPCPDYPGTMPVVSKTPTYSEWS